MGCRIGSMLMKIAINYAPIKQSFGNKSFAEIKSLFTHIHLDLYPKRFSRQSQKMLTSLTNSFEQPDCCLFLIFLSFISLDLKKDYGRPGWLCIDSVNYAVTSGLNRKNKNNEKVV